VRYLQPYKLFESLSEKDIIGIIDDSLVDLGEKGIKHSPPKFILTRTTGRSVLRLLINNSDHDDADEDIPETPFQWPDVADSLVELISQLSDYYKFVSCNVLCDRYPYNINKPFMDFDLLYKGGIWEYVDMEEDFAWRKRYQLKHLPNGEILQLQLEFEKI
jgi:hypothetical protein